MEKYALSIFAAERKSNCTEVTKRKRHAPNPDALNFDKVMLLNEVNNMQDVEKVRDTKLCK